MSKLANAIKKAACALQIAIAPHEIGAPVEGTTSSMIVPAAPDEDRDLQNAQREAARIIQQLQVAPDQRYDLDEATREIIKRNILAAGPPRDAFVEINRRRADGSIETVGYETLDGKAYVPAPMSPVYAVRMKSDPEPSEES